MADGTVIATEDISPGEPTRCALTVEEVRVLMSFIDQATAARARIAMAKELQDEYISRLRLKYGLGAEWILSDLLVGFVKLPDGGKNGT